MKPLHLSILISLCIILSSNILLQNASGLLLAQTPLQLYSGNDIILIGKVMSLQKTGNFTEEYHYDIQVEEYIKNKQPNAMISVVGEESSIPSSPKFEVGDRVLLMLGSDEKGNYIISPASLKTVPGCNSHQMLGFRAFPDEPMSSVILQDKFTVDKTCLDPLIEIYPSFDLAFSPLVQFKAGTEAKDVSCKEGLVLVIKSDNGFPACVTPIKSLRLVMQGWVPGPINKVTTDLHNVYYNDDKIDFFINFKGFAQSCDYPHITILDSNHGIIWKANNLAELCDPEMQLHPVYVNQTYQLSDGLGGPVTINQTGDYVMKISFYDQRLDANFTVISEHKHG